MRECRARDPAGCHHISLDELIARTEPFKDGAAQHQEDRPSLSPAEAEGPQGLPAAAWVSAGGSHSMALDSSGNVWAWGDNEHGQVGDASTTDTAQPVEVLSGVAVPSGSPGASSVISAGSMHSLALEGS